MSALAPTLFALLTVAPPAPAMRTRIAVVDLRSTDALKPVARRANEAILLELAKNPDVVAIGQSELDVLVAHERDKQELAACDGKEACIAKLRAIVDAEKLITGHVGAWGPGYLVTLALADARKAVAERAESCTVDRPEDLEPELARTVQRLLGTHTSTTPRFALPSSATTKVAVLDLAAYDVRPELAQSITQLLALELKKLPGLGVVSRDEIQTMLQYEASKQIIQCKEDIACLVEIGGALGVEYLVSGGLGRLDDTWVIHLKLMNVAKAEVANRVSENFRGPEKNLAQAIRFASWALLGKLAGGRGTVSITADAPDARAAIDGGAVTLDLATARELGDLPAGKHVLAVRADGYVSLEQDFYIEDRQLTALRAELIELPKEWYEEWWPWAIIGGTVAAGVTASIIIANQSGTTPVHVTFE